MIEVNLLPGGKKRRPSKGGGGGGGGFLQKLPIPSLGSLSLDGYTIASVVVVAGGLALLGWWYVGLSSRQEDVAVALADALQDSSNYADLIQRNATLEARRDSVAQKVSMIQDEVLAVRIKKVPEPPGMVSTLGEKKGIVITWRAEKDVPVYNLYWSNLPGVTKKNGYRIRQ